MKQTINFSQFADGLRNEGFSYRGLEILFEYLTEIEESDGIEMEFDPVAIRCDYTECSALQLAEDYGFESDEELESDAWACELINWLNRRGVWFVWVDDSTILYENF
jgi:hypothetical protein